MKFELRKNMIERLKKLDRVEKRKIEASLYDHLTKTTLWKNAQIIAITMSQSFEWDTRRLIERAWQENKTVVIPRSLNKTKTMEFHILKDFTQVVIGYGNIEEPNPLQTEIINKESIDLLIVPGLVFNRAGYRIGFGGGYFDRFLATFSNQTISLISSMQIDESIPVDDHDKPVQYIITEAGLIKTSNG